MKNYQNSNKFFSRTTLEYFEFFYTELVYNSVVDDGGAYGDSRMPNWLPRYYTPGPQDHSKGK